MIDKPTLDVVVPVYNEEKDLPKNIPVLHNFLKKNLADFSWQIIIADNASTDKSLNIAKNLAKKYFQVKVLHLDKKGRGRVLKKAWKESQADFVSYMDVDLSARLEYFPKLIQALDSGYDLAIGSRLASRAGVKERTIIRELMSRVYNLLIKLLFWVSFADAQCGFKALTKEIVEKVLPHVEDNAWFFDTELLILAEKSGFRIAEIPIEWADNPASTVKVFKTAWEDIKGLIRLRLSMPWRRIKK